MRLANIWFRRSPGNRPEVLIPLECQSNMKLRDRVSGKGTRTKGKDCMWEFSLMTNCLTQHMHDEKMCPKEVANFSNCYKNYLSNKEHVRKMMKSDTINPGAKDYSKVQLNNFLKQFPRL